MVGLCFSQPVCGVCLAMSAWCGQELQCFWTPEACASCRSTPEVLESFKNGADCKVTQALASQSPRPLWRAHFSLILWLCVVICPLNPHILHSWPGPLSWSLKQLSLVTHIFLFLPAQPSIFFPNSGAAALPTFHSSVLGASDTTDCFGQGGQRLGTAGARLHAALTSLWWVRKDSSLFSLHSSEIISFDNWRDLTVQLWLAWNSM